MKFAQEMDCRMNCPVAKRWGELWEEKRLYEQIITDSSSAKGWIGKLMATGTERAKDHLALVETELARLPASMPTCSEGAARISQFADDGRPTEVITYCPSRGISDELRLNTMHDDL